ncbi:MAG: formamidopyrimidine-DNA glycosylase [Solirubrobacteraceae bacterium]|nr:formamidopyrimidine-DNA glycosylase [Solirubrobacteraceae bacterium]
MPELPEAERARALVEERALGRRIVGVEDSDTYVSRPHAPGEIGEALRGRRLISAHRRGKAMWFETDGGPTLFLHLGMAGKLLVDEEPHPRWDRFALEFEDGGRLALHDRRRLGRALLDPDLDRVGPDAAGISRDDFRARVGRSSAPIKARLMDQSVLAGLGNLLVDEILWRARLNPLQPASDLSEAQLDDLRRHVRAALRDAIRGGGAHVGKFTPYRVKGGHCPRCGAELMRGTVGGRTTFWCPVDQ